MNGILATMNLDVKKVLVTGGNGFVGTNLCNRLY